MEIIIKFMKLTRKPIDNAEKKVSMILILILMIPKIKCFLFATCNLPSKVRGIVTHLVGWTPPEILISEFP